MFYQIDSNYIPGTVLKRSAAGGLTGKAFLQQVFFVGKTVMLSQIRQISGVDGTTLQNWTRRGWVMKPYMKKYTMDQVAHILIINMLRQCLQLERIVFLMEYINGDLEDTTEDIIRDTDLYDYICRIIDRLMMGENVNLASVRRCVSEMTQNYAEPVKGAKNRLTSALEVIVTAYFAVEIKTQADVLLDNIIGVEL